MNANPIYDTGSLVFLLCGLPLKGVSSAGYHEIDLKYINGRLANLSYDKENHDLLEAILADVACVPKDLTGTVYICMRGQGIIGFRWDGGDGYALDEEQIVRERLRRAEKKSLNEETEGRR